MSICRTCLKTPAKKSVLDLEKGLKKDNKDYLDVMMFCLDITVTLDSKITTKLCDSCFRKIRSFFRFKTLSLKNDAYFKSLEPINTTLDQKDQKSVYVDIEGVKHENFLEPDEFGPRILEEDYKEIKPEFHEVKQEITVNVIPELDHDTHNDESQNYEYEVEVKKEVKKTAPAKKRVRQRKPKPIREVYKGKNRPKICDKCGKRVMNLKTHAVQHVPRSDRPDYQCSECHKMFSCPRAREKHHKIKHLGFRQECDICHKKVAYLAAHKLRVHCPESLSHECVPCGRRFVSRTELAVHVATHTRVFAFECDVCSKRFSSKERIKRHILKVHEKVRPHRCPSCPKSFFDRFILGNHLRSHTNERPYECEECGKTFTVLDNLKQHLRIHGAKAFPCRLCDKTFAKHNYLRNHMISHTKEKKHPCQFCGVRFGRSDHRRRHEYTAHQKHLLTS